MKDNDRTKIAKQITNCAREKSKKFNNNNKHTLKYKQTNKHSLVKNVQLHESYYPLFFVYHLDMF